MPEKKLEKILASNQNYDQFLQNLEKKLPYYLTSTLVQICKVLSEFSTQTKSAPIWAKLEEELIIKMDGLDNDQYCTVLTSFAKAGKGSTVFFDKMEEIYIDSPIPFETGHHEKVLRAFS